MRKGNAYFLVARDRLTNDYEFVSINGKRELSLEEIDSYTTHFKNEVVLEKGLNKIHTISLHGVDFFIVHQNNKKLQKYEVLYEDNDRIRKIADDFDNNSEMIDAILDSFAWDMTKKPLLYEQVVTGRTGIYSKYVKYFISNRSKPSTIKYRDGGWARESYPLIRNIVEATSRKTYNYSLICDKMYRDLLDEDLKIKTDSKYNPDQLSLFDNYLFDPNKLDDTKLLNVLGTFIKLPAATILIDDTHAYFNKSTFSNYADGDLDKLENLLPNDLLLRIRLLLIQRDCMENAFLPYSDKYYRPIEKGQKDLTKLFINHPEMLDKASLWCDLYHSYEEKVLGDVYGREYKKRREC